MVTERVDERGYFGLGDSKGKKRAKGVSTQIGKVAVQTEHHA